MIKELIHSIIICPDWDKDYPRITHGKGVYLFDEDEKKYIDASSGAAAVTNLGHGIEEVSNIISEQIKKVSVLPTHAFSSKVVEEYLTKLVSFSPKGFKRAWTAMSGTEAVENAIKLALQYQQLIGEYNRYKVISRWYSYHGNSIFTLDVGGMKYRRNMYGKWMHNFPHISPAYSYRYAKEMSEDEYCDFCINEFLECIKNNDPNTIAAFIAEPVVGAALGAVVPPKNYFREIRKICDEYGIVFIADEIMTGFGRLGTNFGMEKFNVVPDIIAAGKGISGGYFPLSAVIINEKISLVFENYKSPFKAGHTFACNPVGAAIGSFVIDYINDNQLINNVNTVGKSFRERLDRMLELDIVGDVRGEGLLLGIELVKNKVTKEPFQAEFELSKKVFLEALKKGVILYPGKGSVDGVLGDHILICPPLSINERELCVITDVLYETLIKIGKDLKNNNFINY